MDELVKQLRFCAATDVSESPYPCDGCSYDNPNDYGLGDAWNVLGCSARMMFQAADAIEELSRDLDSMNEANIALYGALPKWIPVTERLPEEYEDVLCYYEYFRYGDYNCMFRTIDRGYYGDGRWGGEAGQGHKNKVLAWMPLPQPPKEE